MSISIAGLGVDLARLRDYKRGGISVSVSIRISLSMSIRISIRIRMSISIISIIRISISTRVADLGVDLARLRDRQRGSALEYHVVRGDELRVREIWRDPHRERERRGHGRDVVERQLRGNRVGMSSLKYDAM